MESVSKTLAKMGSPWGDQKFKKRVRRSPSAPWWLRGNQLEGQDRDTQGHLSSLLPTMKVIQTLLPQLVSAQVASRCQESRRLCPPLAIGARVLGTEPCAWGPATIAGRCCEHRASENPRKRLSQPPMVLPGARHTAHTTELTYYHQQRLFLVKSYQSIS